MKLIWYSTAPHAGVGYGVITKNIVQRMQKDGHEVDVFTKHHWSGTVVIDGMKVMEGCELGLVNKIFDDDKYDKWLKDFTAGYDADDDGSIADDETRHSVNNTEILR